MSLISKNFFLNRSKMLTFLGELEETPDSGAVSFYFLPGLAESEIKDMVKNINIQSLSDELTGMVAASKNGAILFSGEERNYLVLPPFPVREKAVFSGYTGEPLRRLLESDFRIGLILLHLGTYAIGICQGEKLISSKVGTGLVHGRHKKGGSSQQRFQRRRQNQISEFLDRVCLHTREQLEPHSKELDYIIYGGPKQTVMQMQKRCPFLQSLGDRVLPLVDVPSLRQKVLDATVTRVWSSCIIEWQSDDFYPQADSMLESDP
ncbi:Vms1/Ankzf1 family peptidyl-tRNA hydrolase [Chloroflexota bacterium]